jgi:hypothetical protein
LTQSYKICPICRTLSHPNAAICSTCGATLSDIPSTQDGIRQKAEKPTYDNRYGEADLFEGHLSRKPEMLVTGGMVVLAVLICAGVLVFAVPRVSDYFASVRGERSGTINPSVFTPVPTRGGAISVTVEMSTDTPRPTRLFSTVTPAPPTSTATPTQGPCTVQVQPGDDLMTLAFNCGHRSLDIIPIILEMNGLDAPESLQAGEVLEIPWPTPTLGPAAAPPEETEAAGSDGVAMADDGSTLAPAEEALQASHAMATETLQPGVTWHQVQPNENIVVIAFEYGADVEILAQLNPEVTFSQCDFGNPAGGPNCMVQIYAGQLLRVPAPTPVPTLSPTPSGSETATPTATPTFNAPSLVSPDHRSLFERDQLITLRWVGTGRLGRGQAYRVQVEDQTAGVVWTADTQEIFLIVPEAWQGQDAQRHDYQWSVSVISTDHPDNPTFTTEARLFSWQGRGVIS